MPLPLEFPGAFPGLLQGLWVSKGQDCLSTSRGGEPAPRCCMPCPLGVTGGLGVVPRPPHLTSAAFLQPSPLTPCPPCSVHAHLTPSTNTGVRGPVPCDPQNEVIVSCGIWHRGTLTRALSRNVRGLPSGGCFRGRVSPVPQSPCKAGLPTPTSQVGKLRLEKLN